MTAFEYIQSKGLEYRIQGKEAVLKTCPFCGDPKSHFYMSQDEGLFQCHKCSEKGNLVTLQKHLGDYEPSKQRSGYMKTARQDIVRAAFPEQDKAKVTINPERAVKANERLLNDPDALTYITESRGISLEAVDFFKIGLEIQEGAKWLTIPHFIKGKLVNIKFRSLPPQEKTFKRVTGCPSILFNGDILQGKPDTVYICEGEIDVITLWDQGIKNVIGTTAGAGALLPEWIDQLQAVKKIYLVYDPDDAGQKGAREAARRLGYDRCFNMVLPDGQDVNEYFRAGHDLFDFQSLVNEARQFDVAGVMTFADGLKRYREEAQRPDQATGIRTGWRDVDRIIKTGFMPGELIVLGAPPKIGKSTFALQIITHNALQDTPALFFCLEMRPMKIIQKIMQCHNRSEEIGMAEIERARIDFKGKPLFLGYCYQRPTLDGIMDTLKAAIKRYGLKLLCFDHLHMLVRSISNQTQEIGLAVQSFKFLAEELEMPIILIAQPRKIQADSIMTAMDLKDSSSIFSDCDHLIILHRARRASNGKEGATLQTEAYDPITMVRIEASRYNAGGECLLYYHGEYSRFDELETR
jgi:twinkle protein